MRMFMTHLLRVLAVVGLLLGVGVAVGGRPALAQVGGFADSAFQDLWTRTDSLVAQGAVARSWIWGPGPGAARTEEYKEAPGGSPSPATGISAGARSTLVWSPVCMRPLTSSTTSRPVVTVQGLPGLAAGLTSIRALSKYCTSRLPPLAS